MGSRSSSTPAGLPTPARRTRGTPPPGRAVPAVAPTRRHGGHRCGYTLAPQVINTVAAPAVRAVVAADDATDAAAVVRHEQEEPFGERSERASAEPIRPFAVLLRRPEAHEERGRARPHVAVLIGDDEIGAEPRHRSVTVPRRRRSGGEELERDVRRLALEPLPAPPAQRALLVVEHGQLLWAAHDYASTGTCRCGTTGGGSCRTSLRAQRRTRTR